MKTNYFLLLLLVSVILSFCGCNWIESFKKGCFEEKYTQDGITKYSCSEEDSEDYPPDFSGPYGVEMPDMYGGDAIRVYYDDISCRKLGYPKAGEGRNQYISKDGINVPGKNSFWAGGGGGGNTPAFCADGYESPNVGPQVDGFCEMAFNAQCILGVPNTDERVTSPCNTWKDWQQMDPSIPNCKYCP